MIEVKIDGLREVTRAIASLDPALGKELGSILSGGTAPAVASGLLAAFGAWWPLAIYWAIMAGTCYMGTEFCMSLWGVPSIDVRADGRR